MKPKGQHPHERLKAISLSRDMKPGRYADGNGLYLYVDKSGAKRWVLRTNVHGKRRDLGLGGLALVGLADARKKARDYRRIAREGGDPVVLRKKVREGIPTFEMAAREVYRHLAPGWKNKKHGEQWMNTLTAYVFPVFGQKPVDTIDTSDTLKALTPIWYDRPETARRVRQRIKTVMDWAKVRGFFIGTNPVEGLSRVLKPVKKENHHKALEYIHVPTFVEKLRASDNGEPVKIAFELLILTATRTNEVLSATKSEFDLDNALWIIPKSRMKADREHRIPLAPHCIEIVKRAFTLAGDSEYVFPGRRADKPLSNMALLMALRRMGHDFTVHGFRSTFRDWAGDRTNFPRQVCEAALAHTNRDKVEDAYLRTTFFEKRKELMNTWAAFATSQKGEVITLRLQK